MRKIRYLSLILVMVLCGVSLSLIYHATQKADISFYKGERLFREGRYGEATLFYEEALRIGSTREELYRRLGESYLWSERPAEAVRLFERLKEDLPGEPGIKEALAQAYSWSGDHERAIALYERMLISSYGATTGKALAELYMWNGRVEEAEQLLSRLLADDPDDHGLRLLMGQVLYHAGRHEEAAEVLQALLKDMDEQ